MRSRYNERDNCKSDDLGPPAGRSRIGPVSIRNLIQNLMIYGRRPAGTESGQFLILKHIINNIFISKGVWARLKNASFNHRNMILTTFSLVRAVGPSSHKGSQTMYIRRAPCQIYIFIYIHIMVYYRRGPRPYI